MSDPKDILLQLFQASLDAADPLKVIPPHLPKPPKGRTFIIGAGKASAAMAKAVEENWDTDNHPLTGLVVTRYDYGVDCQHIKIIEAAHPVPDAAGMQAAYDILDLLKNAQLTEDDLVICVISGGGSALLSVPAPCLNHEEKRAINKALLKSGAPISEMNCVRKHLSAVKGGRLAQACQPAQICTLLISDVPGDDPSVIASGPTVPDPSTRQEALAIINKYKIDISDKVRSYLESEESETPKALPPATIKMAATAQTALEAAAKKAQELGITPYILSDAIEGEAKDCGQFHAALAKQIVTRNQPFKAPCVVISGGETTVTIKGNGRGGRNTEFLLSMLIDLNGHENIAAIACDTDGIDGIEDNAGAYILPSTLEHSPAPKPYLENNDAYSFFEKAETLIKTGPTKTNVNDFRAILIK